MHKFLKSCNRIMWKIKPPKHQIYSVFMPNKDLFNSYELDKVFFIRIFNYHLAKDFIVLQMFFLLSRQEINPWKLQWLSSFFNKTKITKTFIFIQRNVFSLWIFEIPNVLLFICFSFHLSFGNNFRIVILSLTKLFFFGT